MNARTVCASCGGHPYRSITTNGNGVSICGLHAAATAARMLDPWPCRCGTKTGAGKVLPRYEVAIFDTEDQPLPAGQAGELVIREVEAGVMATGYLGQPDVTAETWRDGWFRTGDLCRLDDVGDVYWLSRLKERIRVKGEMVSAYEIEEVVLNHPAVADCGVLGLPDGTGEETIHVAAELKRWRRYLGA